MVSDMLETMEGRRRGPVGGEENAGKPNAQIPVVGVVAV